jgi:hypothetical protein
MAGFDTDGARNVFDLPDDVRALAIVAVGSLADSAEVPDEIVERDSLPRHRMPLEEVAFAGSWGRPFHV